MTRAKLKDRLKQGVFLLDGAMGTELIARGIETAKANNYLNIEQPDVIAQVHQAYLNAGSDAVLTNTFGANRYALGRHGFGEQAEQINKAGAQVARKIAGEDRYVLGDIGPSGDFLEPLGTLKADDLTEAFAQQARGLAGGGVDGFIIETMAALDEITIAVEAVKSVAGDLPVFASMAFESAGGDFKTMMGVGIAQAVNHIVPLGVDAVGFNCGAASLDEYVQLAREFISAARAAGQDIPVLAEPNAGRPQLVDDKVVYSVSPQDFAAALAEIHSAGAAIVGGCCGTGPAHIAALAKKLRTIYR